MSKLAYAINLTIDGCCDHTKVNGSEDIHVYFTDLIRKFDLLVYGRKTYELMVPFWPDVARNHSGQTNAMNDFAQAFDSVDKIVFSRSLDKVEDKRSRIVRDGPQEAIGKLKRESGKNMLLGGVDFSSQLIALGLVDEFYFVVHPIVAGEGTRLLKGISLQEKLSLRLVESKVLPSGCMALHYVKHSTPLL
jgi:dihydrofolate reductase